MQDAVAKSLEAPEFLHGVEQGFWRLLDRAGDVLYVEVWASDGDCYLLEMQCDRLGDEPIRGRFVDPASRICTEAAWPHGSDVLAGWFKWQSSNFFICWPGDRGGIAHHGEWRAQRYWTREANQVVQYLEFMRRCLTIPSLGYRPRPRPTAA